MSEDAGRVRIGEKLRGDATGDWHRAEHAGRERTLRILREDLAGRDDARMLFEEEMRRIGRLEHPALLRVHHVSRKPPRPWMLTDPIDGPSLDQALADGALEAEAVLALGEALVDAFAYLEARRQVHAALVPVRLVRVDEDWRLLTFRDVRAWDELKSLKGRRWADAAFAPPEQAREHPEPLRPRPYLAWGLGALLRFAAGAGAPRTTEGAMVALPDGLPTRLAAPVALLTAADPAARPQGIPALRRALAGEAPPEAAPDRPPMQAPVPKRKRRR